MLQNDTVDTQESFLTLGGNSLSALKLILSVNQHFGTSLSLGQLFENSSITQLARVIEEKGSQTQTARVTLNRGQPEDNPTLLLSTQRAVTCCVIPGWRVNWAKAIRSTVFRCPILALTNLITPISKRLRFLSFTGW
ncbi:phosphopantetheine-binding protein [Pectobacterium atrosepticum]|uniref:phosphopantetheine-binding protein n=1 Tax=Pectobacterium atrosepticum TaxID=29471 RepID=UPI001CF4483A|nr:phosphopantetheine-binding protein [Pectobacterium atrosepticum]MCA6979353.1 phosphopantetheine-binding protein [Pectobacterium atrosepticum]MDK9442924.1 phosphopantetheine-binding protein [Pectobacterium atrosepticum]